MFSTTNGGLMWRKVGMGPAADTVRVLPEAGGGAVAYAVGTEVRKLVLPGVAGR